MVSKIKLPKNPGISGWNAILPSRVPHDNLAENLNADYLIIGVNIPSNFIFSPKDLAD